MAKKPLREILSPKKKAAAELLTKKLRKALNDFRAEKALIIHFDATDATARETAMLIIESGQEISFGKRYSARVDRGLQPNQQDHVHVFMKGKQIGVVNMDGSPSHKSDLSQIPNHLRPKLKKLEVTIEESYLIVETAHIASHQAELRANIAAIERGAF